MEFTMTISSREKEIEQANQRQRRFFNENVDLFEPPLPKGVPRRLKAIIKASRLRRGERVLDVGTGTGVLIHYILERRPSEIHACDLAENMLRRVKEKFPQVITHLCDIRELKLIDDSLDVAFMNACFSNIMDKSKSLDNLYRLLSRKGRLVVSHPMGRDFIAKLRKHEPYPLDLLPDEAGARELCGRHGFKITLFVDEPLSYIFVAETAKKEEASAAGRKDAG